MFVLRRSATKTSVTETSLAQTSLTQMFLTEISVTQKSVTQTINSQSYIHVSVNFTQIKTKVNSDRVFSSLWEGLSHWMQHQLTVEKTFSHLQVSQLKQIFTSMLTINNLCQFIVFLFNEHMHLSTSFFFGGKNYSLVML